MPFLGRTLDRGPTKMTKITLPSEALKSTLVLLGVPTVAAAHGTKVLHKMAFLDMICC